MNTYLLIPLVLLLTGFIPVLTYRRITSANWNILIFGAGTWILSVALKSIFAYFFNTPINIFLTSIYIPLYYIYIGLLTGIFEIFVPLFIIYKYKENFSSVKNQIGFGIAFGSIEAIIIGITTLIVFFAVKHFPGHIPHQTVELLNQSLSATSSEYIVRSLAAGIERLSATMIHVFCGFMLFMFIFYNKKLYLIVPFLLKTFTDGFALFFAANNFSSLYFESFYLTIGFLCLFIMFTIMKSKNLKLSYEKESKVERTHSKGHYLLKLKAAGVIFVLVGWFLLFAVIFEKIFEKQLLEIEAFVESDTFRWGLKFFVLGLLMALVRWQSRIDETIKKHKWLRVIKNVIFFMGVIGWIIGLGSLIIK